MFTNHNFQRRERRAEADRTEVLLLASLARASPLGHAGSHFVLLARSDFKRGQEPDRHLYLYLGAEVDDLAASAAHEEELIGR